jgi:tetratricopeptide (TPR) repeat protein
VVRADSKQIDAALSDFDEALRLDPSDAQARFHRARLRRQKLDFDGARADLQALDQSLPPQADMRRRMGDLYMAIHLPVQAVPQYDHWIAAHPKQVDLHEVLNSRCWARALANVDLDKALDDCNAALDAKPKRASYLDSRALVRLRQDDLRKAMADYDAALELDPKMAMSLFGRGVTHLRLGDKARGLADIAAAKALRPAIEEEAKRNGIVVP